MKYFEPTSDIKEEIDNKNPTRKDLPSIGVKNDGLDLRFMEEPALELRSKKLIAANDVSNDRDGIDLIFIHGIFWCVVFLLIFAVYKFFKAKFRKIRSKYISRVDSEMYLKCFLIKNILVSLIFFKNSCLKVACDHERSR